MTPGQPCSMQLKVLHLQYIGDSARVLLISLVLKFAMFSKVIPSVSPVGTAHFAALWLAEFSPGVQGVRSDGVGCDETERR